MTTTPRLFATDSHHKYSSINKSEYQQFFYNGGRLTQNFR